MTGYVIDDSVLVALAQGNNDAANVIASLDAAETRMAVPAVTLATAQAELSPDQIAILNGVVENLEHLRLDQLADVQHATELSRTLYWFANPRTDISAAHAATVAKRFDWWILTLDTQRWDQVTAELPWRVDLVTLDDPPN